MLNYESADECTGKWMQGTACLNCGHAQPFGLNVPGNIRVDVTCKKCSKEYSALAKIYYFYL